MGKEHYTQKQKFEYIYSSFRTTVEAFVISQQENSQASPSRVSALLGILGGMFVAFRSFGKFDNAWKHYVQEQLVETLTSIPEKCRDAIIACMSKT